MKVWLWPVLALAVVGLVVGLVLVGQENGEEAGEDAPDELEIEDVTTGEGEEVETGDRVEVHYTGRLEDGEVFDSSRDREEPFSFQVGARQVIEGWEQGLIGMQIGGERQLTIPPHLAYGEQGSPPNIGPNSTLIFDIELLAIE